ncbi:MAG: glutaredoxin domain-containing protein [Bdellovibrionales bacterium]
MAKVVIYSKDYCPYCKAAKSLLNQRGIPYEEILIGEGDDAMYKELCHRSGMRTVPQIFNGDELIGGYMELSALNKRDGLDSLKKGA